MPMMSRPYASPIVSPAMGGVQMQPGMAFVGGMALPGAGGMTLPANLPPGTAVMLPTGQIIQQPTLVQQPGFFQPGMQIVYTTPARPPNNSLSCALSFLVAANKPILLPLSVQIRMPVKFAPQFSLVGCLSGTQPLSISLSCLINPFVSLCAPRSRNFAEIFNTWAFCG